MSNYNHDCLICDHVQTVETYGDFECEICGQKYEYEEGHRILLSDKQLKLLRVFMEETVPE